MVKTWTFEPPFPSEYGSSSSKKIFIAAEPNGDAERPDNRDMGEWIRNVPRTGTKFYRYIAGVAAAFKGIDLDPRDPFDPVEILGDWRFLDLVAEEAGPTVTGDFRKRVKNNLVNTLNIISKDKPDVIVLLGSHTQKAFEDIVSPLVESYVAGRLGLPHPSCRVGGYVTKRLVGDPNVMVRPIHEPMMVYGFRGGWKIFS